MFIVSSAQGKALQFYCQGFDLRFCDGLVFAMKTEGFSICDAGPWNLAYFPEGVRCDTASVVMLDFEHVKREKQLRKKQNETFLRCITEAASCMILHPELQTVGNMLRRVLFEQWFVLAADADLSSKETEKKII